jgi:hypothetical protein
MNPLTMLGFLSVIGFFISGEERPRPTVLSRHFYRFKEPVVKRTNLAPAKNGATAHDQNRSFH